MLDNNSLLFKTQLILSQYKKMISQNEWPMQGEYVDFRDKDNNPWQVGLIMLKAKNVVKVRSEGWAAKLDQLVQINNTAHIRPFRTIVRGYTGQVKNPAVRQHWKFTSQQQQQNTLRFVEFINALANKSEHQIKQYLRGAHYFWIDFLLTTTYSSAADLNLSYEYLKQHINFAKKYLDEICEVGIEQWCKEGSQLSENVRAYRESYYEIMDALYIMTGINVRQLSFQKNNENVIKSVVGDHLTHDRYITKYMSKIKLDQTYLKLLSLFEKETFVDSKAIPIPFLFQFFHIFAPIERAILQKADAPYDNMLINKQQRKKIVLRIFNVIKKQIQYLTSAHLKSFMIEKEIQALLNQIKTTYYKYGLEQLTFQWIEKVRLRTIFLLIQSDTLERKLRGIVKLKESIESLASSNELNPYRLKPEQFTIFLSEQRIVEELFENNEHPEILKRGGEICQLLLKLKFIHIDTIIAIWKICSHKHDAVRKVIYQLWIDILQFVAKGNLKKFTSPILDSCNKVNEEDVELFVEQWQTEMLFTFVVNLVKHYEQKLQDRQEIDQIFSQFISLLYRKLIFFENSNQVKNLISSFAKLVNITTLCNKIIKEIYHSIARNQHLRLNMELLSHIYLQSFEKSTYLPANAIQIVFMTFQSPANHSLSNIIFQLMDEIINFSNNIAGHYILTQQQFQNLWKVSQENPTIKTQFYSWLIKKNSDGLFGVPIYEITQSIPHELKSKIFNNFLCDHSKFDYFNLILEELQIFKQFLIFQNDQQNRIELKRLMALMKIVRVKNTQIIGNKFMWDIFLNCKNEEVIRQLSKIMLAFHFNYHQFVDFKTRKGKVVSLMMKLEKHIRDGFKKGNIKLMKHSLIFLKDIIDFVKQKKEPKEIINNYQQYFKASIKILFQNKKYELETFFGVTYYEIKTKIAELIKLDRTKFQMFSMKNEEISLEFAEVPFCFMQEKTIKIIRVLEDEQTIPNIVLNFIKDRIQGTLIDMLQDQSICQNVYKVLEDIQIKVQEGQFLLDKLMNIVQKHQKQSQGQFNKYEVYIYLFYLRILHFMIEKPHFVQKFLKGKQFNKLIQKLDVSINNPLIIVYLYHCIDILFTILKKSKTQESTQQIQDIISEMKENLKEKSIKIIEELCHYININVGDDQKEKNGLKKVRIIFNCLNIIQELQQGDKAVNWLVNHQRFCNIVRKIYANNCVNQIRLIFVEKLKKMLQKYRQGLKNTEQKQKILTYNQIVNKISHFFIGQLYYEIRQKDGTYSDQKKVLYFYKFISFIISLLDSQQFKLFVMEEDQSGSFYNNLLINIKEQHDLPDATASANFILSAHLHILMSIYQKYPALLTQEMLHYLLYDCLFYKKGESNQLQIACKKAETIKAALDVVSAGIANYKDTTRIMKIVTEVQQFHRLDYWRTSDNWSTSIQNEVKAKYAGLENPGCICYHNSLLQQLFMTKGFRSAITGLNLKQQEGESKLEMLKSLKQLFFNLLFSEQIALNPVFFTKTIKSHDNKPLVKIFVQMDIDQFCSILFDKIEHQLNFIPNQPNIVKNIFGGIYAHQIISKECKHCSERQEQFISIGLQVKKNINESFNALIKGQMLDGENKYYCEKCDKKVKAQKILTIKKLPPNLILSIKRFEYNYQIDAKIKINDYCEFPMELNLKKYSQQEINKSNVSQTLQIPQQNVQKGEEDLPDSYFIYKLKGVVVHTGSADSGHYYSFIEDTQKNWFQFNDSSVTPFDLKNLPQEAFGSKDSYDQKVKNAYLLFYERVQVSNQPEPQKSLPSEENSEIISGIIDKNKTISKFRLLFSKDYSGFVDHLLEQISKYDLTLEQQENWYRFIVSYYLLIKIREGTVDEVLPISTKISKLLDSKPKFSSFFFSSFVNFSFIQQVFVFASNRDKVKILSRLLAKAFINAYSELPDNYNALKDTQISNLLNYIKNLTIIHGNICQLDMFIRIVLDYTRSRQDYRLFKFLQHDYEQCLLVNIFGFNFSKQQKQKALAFKDVYKNERSDVLSQAKNQGKKYIPTSTKESWQLIQYFVQYLSNGIVQEQSSLQAELFDPLANINNIIDKAAKGGVITKVIHECGVSKSVYRLYKTFKLIKKLESLVEAIEKGLKDYESTKYRQLLLLLYFIVIDKDCTEQLISVIVGMLEKVHAINQKYFVEVNLIHQWIIKYTKDSRLFLKVLSENEQFLTIIINWIISKPAPSADLIKKHKNPNNQKLLNRLHGILVSADPQDYHKKSKSLKKKFETIRDKNYELFNENNQWQKEYLDEFNQQNEGFYYDLLKKKWNTVKIVDNNFGYLKLAQQNSNDLYIWQDNERFFSFKTLTKQDLESSSSEEQAIVEQKMQEIEEQDLYN